MTLLTSITCLDELSRSNISITCLDELSRSNIDLFASLMSRMLMGYGRAWLLCKHRPTANMLDTVKAKIFLYLVVDVSS